MKNGTEKRLDYQNRYKDFLFLILKYQSLFESVIAPLITSDKITEFTDKFTDEENKTMDWIEQNKQFYLKKYSEKI